jgi:hypothetical protein
MIPVKPYVHMRYIPVKGQKEYCDKIRELSGATDKDKETPDYLEATVYSKAGLGSVYTCPILCTNRRTIRCTIRIQMV